MEEQDRIDLCQALVRSDKTTLLKGDTWYLLDPRWLKQLRKYLGIDPDQPASNSATSAPAELDPSAHPGPLDNSSLFKKKEENGASEVEENGIEEEDEPEIREGMIDDIDYGLVTKKVWEGIEKHFGLVPGQKPIDRKVVEHGMFVKHCKVEVYLVELLLAENSDLEKIKKGKFSRVDTFEHVEKYLRRVFSIPDNAAVKLWSKYNTETFDEIQDLTSTVQGIGLYSGQVLIIEQKGEDGTWKRAAAANDKPAATTNGAIEKSGSKPGSKSGSVGRGTTPTPSTSKGSISTRYNSSYSYNETSNNDHAQPGLCGLSNLGNTCFMNSIIQGLSNCPPITEYFANDNYSEDINEENPLGMKGEIARAFGELVKNMWSGKNSSVMPRNFKMVVGRFAPQFSGYQQHDSQELLTFLLDGLHEDLNRIRTKPYIEMKDSDDRPDEDVAAEAWDIYKKRNDSVILDLFHGLLKSTVVCPECPKVSVTFDPFCFLSLPLPVKKERKIEVFLVYMDPTQCPKQFKVVCPKNGYMRELSDALSTLCGIPSDCMVVTDVYNHRFHKIYTPGDPISNILERDDIFVYETPPCDTSAPPPHVTVPVYLRVKKSSTAYSPSNLFGQPMLVSVQREETNYDALYEAVLNRLSRFVTPPKEEDGEWWKPAPASEAAPAVTQQDASAAEDSSADSATPSSENVSPSGDMPAVTTSCGEDEMEEDEEEDGKGPPKLFAMNFVNSYGNSQMEQINNDGEAIKISGKHYLALDWHPKAKELFYQEKAAEMFTQDPSLEAKTVVRKQVRLEECLELYTSKEKLGENDAWYCPNCKKHQQATKKFDLWSLPALLCISLKRFSYNRYWRDKLDTHVEFPTSGLDMGPYVINSNHGEAIYDLVAVSNHYGGMGGGHYTAYGRNKDDDRWYYFDDSNVSPSSEDAVVTKAAYVLFYQRRDLTRMRRQQQDVSAGSSVSASSPSAATSSVVMNGVPLQNGNHSAASEEDMEVN